MLLDVLSGLPEIRVAVAYEDSSGNCVESMPGHLADLERCHPIFETLPGWSEDITSCRTWASLPENAKQYVRFIAKQMQIPVSIVSVGPDREATLRVE